MRISSSHLMGWWTFWYLRRICSSLFWDVFLNHFTVERFLSRLPCDAIFFLNGRFFYYLTWPRMMGWTGTGLVGPAAVGCWNHLILGLVEITEYSGLLPVCRLPGHWSEIEAKQHDLKDSCYFLKVPISWGSLLFIALTIGQATDSL